MRQFYGAVNAAKSVPERMKLPPAPRPPASLNGVAAIAANAIGVALGIDTSHQRALREHLAAMKQWRDTCKKLKAQDAAAWEQLKALSEIAPLKRYRPSEAKTMQGVKQVTATRPAFNGARSKL